MKNSGVTILMQCPFGHLQDFVPVFVKRGRALGRCDKCNTGREWKRFKSKLPILL